MGSTNVLHFTASDFHWIVVYGVTNTRFAVSMMRSSAGLCATLFLCGVVDKVQDLSAGGGKGSARYALIACFRPAQP